MFCLNKDNNYYSDYNKKKRSKGVILGEWQQADYGK